MSAHLSRESIERYKERKLPAAELLAVDDHLAECDICRNRAERQEEATSFASLRAGLRAEASLQPQHLPFEQLAAYVDNLADDVEREIAESHLELCTSCAHEADELRTFRTEMQAYTQRDQLPEPRSNMREKFLAYWRAPAYRIPLQLAGLLMIAVLIGLLVTLPLTRQITDLQEQVTDLQRANDDLVAIRDRAQHQRPHFDPSAPAQIAAAIYDNEALITMDKNGNLSGLELSPQNQERIRMALLSGQVAAPGLEDLSRRRGTLLGPSDGVPFALISPVGIVTQKERPGFRWRPLAGADNYVVQVFDSSFKKVMVSPPLTVTEWTAGESLERGVIYSWQVVARIDGRDVMSPEPPAPEAKFKVLGQSQAAEVARVKQEYPGSHLVLGVVYAQSGLLDEAEIEFKALVNGNPKSPAAQRLLKRIQALRAAK